MPYTEKQNKLFRAAEHDPAIAQKHNLTQPEAKKLANEGVKPDNAPVRVAQLVEQSAKADGCGFKSCHGSPKR